MILVAGLASNTFAQDENSTTASVMQDSTQETTPSQPVEDLPAEATSTSDSAHIAPVNNVKPFPVGTEWQQRLSAVGIPPDTLWVDAKSSTTPEAEQQLNAQRHYFMGWYYLELKQPGRAIEEFTSSLKFDPGNSHVLLDAARAHLAVREVAEADKLIEQVLDQESTNSEALRLRAESSLAAADTATGDEKESLLKNAIKDLEEARKNQPKNLEVLRALARAYVQRQEVAKVISVYKDIVAVDPRDTYSLLILAQVLSRVDRINEAIPYYQKVIEQRRSFIGGYIFLGQMYERLKRYNDALDLYKQALLVDARNAEVLKRFDDLATQMAGKNTAKILNTYDTFVSEYPGNTEIRRVYAEKLVTVNQIKRAIEQYKKIVEIDPENLDACVSLGGLFAQEKDFGKASEYFRKAVEINPERIDLYDTIASMLLQKGSKDMAIDMYRDAIESNPRAEKLYISLAALLENDSKTTEAVSIMQQAVEKVGEKPELLAVLGKFYRSQKKLSEAEKTLRKAYELEPSNLPLYGELLSVYLEEDKLPVAERITSRTAEKAAQGKDVVYSVAAELYIAAGKRKEAVQWLVSALEANPTKIENLARLIQVLQQQDLHQQALSYLDQFGGRMTEQEKVDLLRARVLSDMGEHDKAIAIAKQVVADTRTDITYYEIYIDILNRAKRFKEALDVLKSVKANFESTEPDAVGFMSGMVYLKQKKYQAAEKAFRELTNRSESGKADAYYFLGSVYLDQKQWQKAEQALKEAVKLNPASANALNALGYLYAERGIKLDEAKQLIQDALDMDPSAPHILDSMGWVLFKQGDLPGALKYVGQAAEGFSDPEVYSHLGQIYEKMGEVDQARDYYNRALKLDSDLPEIRQKLKKLPTNP